jgi:hypothetical protein
MPKRKTEGKSIELRKLQIYERMSEETTAFVADIYVGGIKAGYAKNDGHGGSTDCHPYPEQRKLFEEAESQCLALPPEQVPAGNGMRAFEIKMDLEHFVDNLVTEALIKKDQEKFEKKRNKLMETAIILGVPNGNSYRSLNFKRPLNTVPLAQLQTQVNRCKAELKEGEVILNTNLQALGIVI